MDLLHVPTPLPDFLHIPDRFSQANPVNPDRLFWTNSVT